MRTISSSLVVLFLAITDVLVVVASGLAALLAYADGAYIDAMWTLYAGVSVVGAAIMAQVGCLTGAYRSEAVRSSSLRAGHVILSWTLAILAVLSVVFFFRRGADISRVWVGLWYGMCLAGVVGGRLGTKRLLTRLHALGRMSNRVVVVADTSAEAGEIASRISRSGDSQHVVGVLSCDAGFDRAAVDHHIRIQPSGLLEFLRDNWVHTVIIRTGSRPTPMIKAIRQALADVSIEVLVSLADDEMMLPIDRMQTFGGMPMIQVSQPVLDEQAALLKSLVDRTLAALLLLTLSPVLLIAAVAIKLESPGPVIFRQRRFGYHNVPFEALKLRSMYSDRSDPTGARRTVRRDPRVTSVGRLLRSTSLDEIPQLINVLRGEMSLVGPRAHPVMMKVADKLYQEVVHRYVARHKVKPGLTGLAQINGCRGEVDTIEKAQARLYYDLEYVARWSLWLDLRIMLLTPIKAFRSY